MQKINSIRQIILALLAIVILIRAFFSNNLFISIAITPFIICAIAIIGENIARLLNKEDIEKVFEYIFKISFFAYFFGFLIFALYYSIVNKTYLLIICILIFLALGITFFKNAFNLGKNNKKKSKKEE